MTAPLRRPPDPRGSSPRSARDAHTHQRGSEIGGASRRTGPALRIGISSPPFGESSGPAEPSLFDPPIRESEQGPKTRNDAEPLDTLAQLGQKQPAKPVTGLPSTDVLLRRARAKYFSFPIAGRLAALGSPLEKSYRNTIYCTAELKQQDGKITGHYCGNRWCLVCNRIRTARAIIRYVPIVDGWKDPYFVTLTLRNVTAAELKGTIGGMVDAFHEINRGMRRTDRVKLVGLRKLECTYNDREDTYHPHFHVVVQGERAAQLLHDRWLARHPDNTDVRGQDVRRCTGASLKELFKYFTKLLAKKRAAAEGVASSYPVPSFALDEIFRAMKGRRVYQPVGFVVESDEKPDDEAEEINPQEATAATTRRFERITWEWNQGANDWVDPDSGECLTGYEPSERFRAFVEGIERGPPSLSGAPDG